MSTVLWVLIISVVLVQALWAYLIAQRLDRLHIRVDRSRDALKAALDLRCAVIAAIVPELATLARATEKTGLGPWDVAKRLELEDALRVGVDKHAPRGEVKTHLDDADTRVVLALRFYNEAVRDTRAIRLRPVVRALRLGGTAPLPEYCALSAIDTVS